VSPRLADTRFAQAIDVARRGGVGANDLLSELAHDHELPAIQRATALSLLHGELTESVRRELRAAAHDADPLLRLGAARSLQSLSATERVASGAGLLSDAKRAIRVEAAFALADTPLEQLPAAQQPRRAANMQELLDAKQVMAERPETQLELAQVYARLGRLADSERALRRALDLDPRSLAARVNLADFYRQTRRDALAEPLLREATQLTPQSAVSWHALGLLQVRAGKRADALTCFARATELAPNEADYAYVYAIALTEAQRRGDARAVIADALMFVAHSGSDPTLPQLRSGGGCRAARLVGVERKKGCAPPPDPALSLAAVRPCAPSRCNAQAKSRISENRQCRRCKAHSSRMLRASPRLGPRQPWAHRQTRRAEGQSARPAAQSTRRSAHPR
jgi:tetratricopeptide (TPR) repeat protein